MQQDRSPSMYYTTDQALYRRADQARRGYHYSARDSIDCATLVSYITNEYELSDRGDEDGCFSAFDVKSVLQWIHNALKFRRIRRYLRPNSRVAVLREPRFWSLSLDGRPLDRPR